MPVTRLDGKKCLITGAASGIGRALAEASAREGAELFLTDLNAEALAGVAATIRADGGRVSLAWPMDIADYETVKRSAQDIHSRFGSLDILMNVAGISVWGAVENLRHEHWRRCVDINLMGPIHVIECFIPEMIKAGRGGRLVNVSSAAGLFGLPWHAAYSASKFGLRGISEVLRFDLRRHGIKVSLVCPGGVDTGLVNTVEILGVDLNNNAMRKLKEKFRRRAVSPQSAAHSILKGVKAGRYMIFTSLDIRLGYWLQRKFAWPFDWFMQLLNNRLYSLARHAPARAEDVYGPAR